jgi:serine/threonine protein phosphatase PrpC
VSDAATVALRPLHAAFRTDPGRVRTNNEDVPLVDAERGIYGVIDGVGGQAAGELAAAIACDVILQRLSRPLGTSRERVRESIAIANNEIFRRASTSDDLAGMTCVVTLAIVADGRLTIGHVGDSRLYKIRPDGIQKLTHDHSPVGEREDAQEISETDAMQHPRRHEVFRDVGGALRDKDEDDYVEVIDGTMERDAAILLCSDGLTDMVPSSTLLRIVRQHAGSPEEVVDALVAAANDAGGRDNVTVVYAEAPEFARAMHRYGSDASSAPVDLATQVDAPEDPATDAPKGHPVARVFRWIVGSRLTWFALGAVAGVFGALYLVWRTADPSPIGKTIVVSPVAAAASTSLAEALRTAVPGDLLRLEPGTYAERVVLPDGVSLVARVAGSVTFVRPVGGADAWVAISAGGDGGGRIAGVRIESTPEQPVDVGIRLTGQSRPLELVEMSGPMRAGVDLAPGASASIEGGRFSVSGTAIALADRAQLTAAGNVFLKSGRLAAVPLTIGDATQLSLKHNVFVGFGTDVIKDATPAERQQILTGNVIVSADSSPVR